MEIAVLGYRRELRNEVERYLRAYLDADGAPTTRQYGLDEPVYNAAPQDIVAAFVIVDDAKALSSLRKVAAWGENLPVVVVSNHPQYAMEGIRLQVRHYLLFPLTDADMREALSRIGMEVSQDGNHSGI